MKILGFLMLSAILILVLIFGFRQKLERDISLPVYAPTPTSYPLPSRAKNQKPKLSLFVPYWTLSEEQITSDNYSQIIYFGLNPNSDKDLSYHQIKNIEKFISITDPNLSKAITINMTNNKQNLEILKDPKKQQKIIDQAIDISNKYGFKEIILDLEITAIPFDSLTKQISAFTGDFFKNAKANNLSFSQAIYGDALYRPRPYDLKSLAQNTDRLFIMAYDFHKPLGNPGPNFPLSGQQKYGYDLKTLTDSLLKIIPPQKITFIFGYFGYDWTTDQKQNSTQQAKSLSYNEIKQNFIENCRAKNCKTTRDQNSSELNITYTDENNKNHSIWLDDPKSIKEKQAFLQTRNISSYSFWAYSYF